MDGLAPASIGPATGPQLDNRRVLAALVDIALLFPVALLMSALFGGFTGAAAALTLGWALYYYFALESSQGQTLGKRVMKIRVARADGSPLDSGRVAVRTLLRPIDGIGAYLVGLVVMLATGERRQRLGDLAAGTVVTEADAPQAPEPEPSVAAPEASAAVPAPQPEPEPLPDEPVGDTRISPEQVPVAPPFEPLSEPERVVEPDAEAESEPVAEPDPEPEPHEIVPVEPEPEPEPEADEPQAEEPQADEPEVVEPEAEEPDKSSRLEIVTSPIDLVMQDDEEPGEDPEDPQPASA